MNKSFKFYAGIWTVLLAIWCVIVFFLRPIIPEYIADYDNRFFTVFTFILITFIGNLICAFFAFSNDNPKKMFLNMPLIIVSWSALITMLVCGTALILIPNCPAWSAIIVCAVILAFNAMAVIKAIWTADMVSNVDEKVKAQTSYIRNLMVDTEGILSRAKSDAVKSECIKVHDQVRYSDPMSHDALSVIEAKITVKVDEFSSSVIADDVEKAKAIAEELIILIAERNKKCKALKG